MEILGRRFPSYELVLIAAGPVVLGLVWLLLRRTRFGVLVRAATQDRDMVAALGVNQAMLFTGTLFLGAFLAGLGGALQIPRVAGQYGHGPVDHRRGLRRHRGRRHGQRAGRLSRGARSSGSFRPSAS